MLRYHGAEQAQEGKPTTDHRSTFSKGLWGAGMDRDV